MKHGFLIITFLLVLSCAKQDPEAQMANLGGYWEIEAVVLPNGSVKTFGMSNYIDFIQITGDSGIRKKVSPQLDGSFLVNDAAEKFDIRIEHDSLNLYYYTPFDRWKESVMYAADGKLEVLNKDGKLYRYRRFKRLETFDE